MEEKTSEAKTQALTISDSRAKLGSMNCPYCHQKGRAATSRVIDSRPIDRGLATRRRMECSVCRKRFSSYERLKEMMQPGVTPALLKLNGKTYKLLIQDPPTDLS